MQAGAEGGRGRSSEGRQRVKMKNSCHQGEEEEEEEEEQQQQQQSSLFANRKGAKGWGASPRVPISRRALCKPHDFHLTLVKQTNNDYTLLC